MPGQNKTLRQFFAEMKLGAKKAWYDARTAYHAGSRKLSELVNDAAGAGRSMRRGVERSAEGHRYLRENAPQARENIEKLSRDLKKK